MTYQTSSNKLFISEIKQRLWAIILMFIIFFVSEPLSILMRIDNFEIYNLPDMIPQNICNYLSFGFAGDGRYGLFAGFIMAFLCFGFLYSKSAVDLYHSLPVKRCRIYLYKLVTGAGIGSVILLINGFLSALVISLKGYMTGDVSLSLFLSCAKGLVGFLFAFSVSTVGIMLTGMLVMGVIGSAILMVISTYISWIWDSYMSLCFCTYYSKPEITVWYALLCPMKLLDLNTKQKNLTLILILLTVEMLVFMVIGCFLYRNRPSECIAKSLSFNISKPIIRIPIVILAALTGGIYVSYVASSLTECWYWIAFVGLGIVTHIVLDIVFEQELKGAIKHPIQLLACLAVSAVISLVMQYDVIGYDTYIPISDRIETATVRLYNIEGYASRYEKNINNEWTYLSTDNFFETVTCDTDAALNLAKAGIACLNDLPAIERRQNEMNEYYDANTINSYAVCYHMKDGRDIYRLYTSDIKDTYDDSDRVYSEKSYKDYIYQLYEYADTEYVANLIGSDMLGDESFSYRDVDLKGFFDAYIDDLFDRTLDDIKEYPIYSLSSYDPMNGFDMLSMYYVYESDERTVEFLKNSGVDVDSDIFKLDADSINHIKVYDYNDTKTYAVSEAKAVVDMAYDGEVCEYTKENDFAKIKELAPKLVPSNAAYLNQVLHPLKTGIELAVTFEDKEGKEKELNCNVPLGTVVY